MTRRQNKKWIRIKFKRNQIIFISVILAVALSIFLYDFYTPKPITEINYDGIILVFRADLKEAKNVPVYPSEQALYYELMNPLVENITIAAKEAGEGNPYYTLQTYELVTKLKIAYLGLGLNPSFNREPLIIDSYKDLRGDPQSPIIALVHPLYSNETAIRVEDHVVFIKAKDYKDFDLAIAKFSMVVLKIEL